MYNWRPSRRSARNIYPLFVPYFGQLYFCRVQLSIVALNALKIMTKVDFSSLVSHHGIMDQEEKSRWPKYAVITLIIVVILLLILILFLYLIRSPLIFRSGASSIVPLSTEPVNPSTLSLENSYIFASPLRAKTGGEKIRITVYVLDSRGLGISERKVTINGGTQLTVAGIQSVTDSQGRATFDLASDSSPGTFIIQAFIDGAPLPQKAIISFD